MPPREQAMPPQQEKSQWIELPSRQTRASLPARLQKQSQQGPTPPKSRASLPAPSQPPRPKRPFIPPLDFSVLQTQQQLDAPRDQRGLPQDSAMVAPKSASSSASSSALTDSDTSSH